MNAISNPNVINLVRCSWCNKVGHEITSCSSWIGCIAHEREKQHRLKEMQSDERLNGAMLEDAGDILKGLTVGLTLSAGIWILIGYLILR